MCQNFKFDVALSSYNDLRIYIIKKFATRINKNVWAYRETMNINTDEL